MDNLLQMLGDQMTPDVMGQLSNVIGEDEAKTKGAVGAAMPMLMGAMMKKGSTESGAADLMGMIQGQADGGGDVLGNFAGMLGSGGGDSNPLMSMGGSMLPGLLGGNSGGALGMISKVAGIGEGSSSKLMTMLAPLAMGVLGKKVLGGGMGASGMMDLLAGQSEFVEKAAPPGMAGALGLTGFGDLNTSGIDIAMPKAKMPEVEVPEMPEMKAPEVDVPDMPEMKAPEVDVPEIKKPDVEMPKMRKPEVEMPKVERPSVERPKVAMEKPAAPSGGLPGWLLPLLGLLGVIAVGWFALNAFSGPDIPAAVCTNVTGLVDDIDGMPAISADTSVDDLSGTISNLRSKYNAVSSAASGIDIDGLSGLGDNLGSLEDAVSGVSGGTLGAASGAVSTALSGLTSSADSVVDAAGCN